MEALTRESLHENWGVKTLTVFPHFTNTRKEMIDYARQRMGYVKLQILHNDRSELRQNKR